MPVSVHHLSTYDYAIMGSYLVFMLSLGFLFRKLSRNTSDYFRCGGAMPWWVTGASAWVAGFTAWTFVGAASEVYRSGLKVLILFYASIPAFFCIFFFTCTRFRRLRVITWIEAVRERFGPATEQFYTWLKVPFVLLTSGLGLMTISLFMSAVFGAPIWVLILILGVTITLVAFSGGAFAVLASDFVQMFLVVTIALVAALLSVRQPEIGGLFALLEKVHISATAHFQSENFHWWRAWRPSILVSWGILFVMVKMAEQNSMEYATMYLMSKSDKHARRMVSIPIIGTFIGPLIWVIPPLAATILFPDLKDVFPSLSNPSEGAFVAVAMKVMPVGLLGLLLCAMFGATLTSMDAGVNKSVGVFVRSFYKPILKPAASEKHLLITGKVCTLAFGVIIIGVALLVNAYRSKDLFNLANQLGVSLGLPLTMPILYGLYFKKTPQWSALAAAIAGFAVTIWANFIFAEQVNDPEFLSSLPDFLQGIIGDPGKPLTSGEINDLLLVVTAGSTMLAGTLVFFATSIFYKTSSPAHVARVEHLFDKLRTPVIEAADAGISDEPLYRLLGTLSMVYGVIVLSLMLIPNDMVGRLCFLFIGGVIGIGGVILYLVANKKKRQHPVASVPREAVASHPS